MNAHAPIRADQQGDPLDEDFPLPAERLAALRARAAALLGKPAPTKAEIAAANKRALAARLRADAAVMGLADALLKGMEP